MVSTDLALQYVRGMKYDSSTNLCTWALLRISVFHFLDLTSIGSFGNLRLRKPLQKSVNVLPEPFEHQLLQNKENRTKFRICINKAGYCSFGIPTSTFKRLQILPMLSFSKILLKTGEKLLSVTLITKSF